MGDLAIGLFTGDDDDSPSALLDEAGVVGGFRATDVRGAQDRRPKRLWCLHSYQRGTRRRVDNDVVGIDPLDRVGDRNSRHGGISPFADGADDCCEQLRRCEWSSRIVNADDRRTGWDRGEAGSYRLAARRPTGNASLGRYVSCRNHHDDAITCGTSGVDRMIDDPPRADVLVLFGTTEA